MKNRVWALLVSVSAVFVGCQIGRLKPAGPGPVADNMRCHVCHINYEEEELAVRHARANVSCEKCHGVSDPHCGDENNITPPDIMYPKAKINPSCMHCHPARKLARKKEHKPLLAAAPAKQQLCTDCHGQHRLARREVRWDKTTGKLLPEE